MFLRCAVALCLELCIFVGVVGVRRVKGSVWGSEKVMCGSCARRVRVQCGCFYSCVVLAPDSCFSDGSNGSSENKSSN